MVESQNALPKKEIIWMVKFYMESRGYLISIWKGHLSQVTTQTNLLATGCPSADIHWPRVH